MKTFKTDYLKFERKHLAKLEDLWYKTNNEDLRKVILDARKVLEYIFDGDDRLRQG